MQDCELVVILAYDEKEHVHLPVTNSQDIDSNIRLQTPKIPWQENDCYVLWSEHVINKYLMEQINSGIQKKPSFYSKILSYPSLGMSTKCMNIFLPWIKEQRF